jgi:hypothetical protein
MATMKWIFIISWFVIYGHRIDCPYGIKECMSDHYMPDSIYETMEYCDRKEAFKDFQLFKNQNDTTYYNYRERHDLKIDSIQLHSVYRYFMKYPKNNVGEWMEIDLGYNRKYAEKKSQCWFYQHGHGKLDSIKVWQRK